MPKKVIPKHQKVVEPKHNKTVVPKWNILEQGAHSIRLDRAQFTDDSGNWNAAALWQARQQYPGKDITFGEKDSPLVYRQKSLFFEPDGTPRPGTFKYLEELRESGKKTAFYEMPRAEPSQQPTMVREKNRERAEALARQKEERAKLAKKAALPKTREIVNTHPAYSTVRLIQKQERRDGKWVDVGPPKMVGSGTGRRDQVLASQRDAKRHHAAAEYARLKKIIASGDRPAQERIKAAKELRQLSVTFTREWRRKVPVLLKNAGKEFGIKFLPDKKKTSVPRVQKSYRPGDVFDKKSKFKLRPSQYVDDYGRVRNTSVARAELRRQTQRRGSGGHTDAFREKQRRRQQIEQMKREAKRNLKQAAAVEKRRRAQERRRARDRMYKEAKREARRAKDAIAARMYNRRLRAKSGYGKVPLKMLVRGTGLDSRATPGRKTALAGQGRDVKYPPMRHAERTRAPTSIAAMLKSVGMTGLDSETGRSIGVGRGAGMIFATTTTISTDKFQFGGRGVFFRINADQVIHSLVQKFPAALARGAAQAGEKVGKKLLDIVEPYVPKDTGLLYSTAQTNTRQTATGNVDLDGMEAYPADQMFGVSISYNAPYAELVYNDVNKRHGAAYNAHYGTNEKGEKETAKWIEVAFAKEGVAIQALLNEYAVSIRAALQAAGSRNVSFVGRNGMARNFWTAPRG